VPSTKLEKLLISEVSGVDDPASLLPGWMVTKAARTGFVAAVESAADSLIAEIPSTFKVERANPHQRRDDSGRYARHVPGITDTPAAVEHPPVPAAETPAEKQTSFFSPARNAYRRIF